MLLVVAILAGTVELTVVDIPVFIPTTMSPEALLGPWISAPLPLFPVPALCRTRWEGELIVTEAVEGIPEATVFLSDGGVEESDDPRRIGG